ncbi:MAG: universal stress protein [Nitrososphaeria archaeon]|nr:universal stress protein [Nitrososphaeria archaeon]
MFDKGMFYKILVPVDGSEYAERAVRTAVEIAERYEAEVTLIHVVEKHIYAYSSHEFAPVVVSSQELEDEGKEILRRSKEIAESLGKSVDTMLVSGVPAEEILKLAETEKFDLIVVGSRGLSRVKSFLLGSVSDKICHHASCPTLVIR